MATRHAARLLITGALVLPLLGQASSGAAGPPVDVPAAARAASEGDVATSFVVQRRAAARAVRYWTPERMAAAEPLDLTPSASPRPAPRRMRGVPLDRSGPDSIAPAGRLGAVEPSARRSGRAAHRSRAADRPYTDDLRQRTSAKLFGRFGGFDYVCSATVVNSRTKDMVSTAGHCVHDLWLGWAKNVVVVPAFKSRTSGPQQRPFGTWRARRLTTTGEWRYFENFSRDLGYINVFRRNGRTIVGRVGGLGTKFGTQRDRVVSPRGYPAAPPFPGTTQRYCGPSRPSVLNHRPMPAFRPGPTTMGAACDMTPGSSGGAWTGMWGGRPFQVSVNSYQTGDDFNTLYGPYFGGAAKGLFNHAARR